MRIIFFLFLIVPFLWNCDNIQEEDPDKSNDTTSINEISIDTTTILSNGIIVDSTNVGNTYATDSGFPNHIQMEAKNIGNDYIYDGWTVEINGKTKWVDFCAPQFSCKSLLLNIPGDKLSPGIYKYRYVYSDKTGLHRYFSSVLTFTVFKKN